MARSRRLLGLHVALVAFALLVAASASARQGGQIYFWANLGYPVSSPVHGFPNPPVVRPRTLVIFVDGQWVIEKLHWKGWGSPVARGKGLSSSSNDDPNAVEGKRIITGAKVTLSKPGVFHGRRIYRCIRIKVPRPAHFGSACLQRSGKSVGLSPPGLGTPVGIPGESGSAPLTEFLSPDKKVWCTLGLGSAFCGVGGAPGAKAEYAGTIANNGKVTVCSIPAPSFEESCLQNWDSAAPVLGYGETTEAKGFRCTSARNGITCVKVAGAGKGNGFRVSNDGAVGVGAGAGAESGPATAGGSPPQLWSALEGKVTCGIFVHSTTSPPRYLLCASQAIPPPPNADPSVGDPGFVTLGATGIAETHRLSQYSWQVQDGWEPGRNPKLAAGATWRFGPIGITCTVTDVAVSCVNRDGHGYAVNADEYTPL